LGGQSAPVQTEQVAAQSIFERGRQFLEGPDVRPPIARHPPHRQLQTHRQRISRLPTEDRPVADRDLHTELHPSGSDADWSRRRPPQLWQCLGEQLQGEIELGFDAADGRIQCVTRLELVASTLFDGGDVAQQLFRIDQRPRR